MLSFPQSSNSSCCSSVACHYYLPKLDYREHSPPSSPVQRESRFKQRQQQQITWEGWDGTKKDSQPLWTSPLSLPSEFSWYSSSLSSCTKQTPSKDSLSGSDQERGSTIDQCEPSCEFYAPRGIYQLKPDFAVRMAITHVYCRISKEVEQARASGFKHLHRLQTILDDRPASQRRIQLETDPCNQAVYIDNLRISFEAEHKHDAIFRKHMDTLDQKEHALALAKISFQSLQEGKSVPLLFCSLLKSTEPTPHPGTPVGTWANHTALPLNDQSMPKNRLVSFKSGTSYASILRSQPAHKMSTAKKPKSTRHSASSSSSSKHRIIRFADKSQHQIKYFVPPHEAEGVKSPLDRIKVEGVSGKARKFGRITWRVLETKILEEDSERFKSFLRNAPLDHITPAFDPCSLAEQDADKALEILATKDCFLSNPACKTTFVCRHGSDSEKHATLQKLLGVIPYDGTESCPHPGCFGP